MPGAFAPAVEIAGEDAALGTSEGGAKEIPKDEPMVPGQEC